MELHDLRRMGLFAGTADDQLLALLEAGTTVTFERGDVLFQEDHPATSWWVLLDGSIDLLRHVGGGETQLGVLDVPGRWAGGFRAWDEHGAYLATGRAATAGCVLRVPAEDLRELWATRFPLGVQLIEGVSRSARNYESMARQREALAALGTLAAGLAHELNNPAAAATRAVDSLGDSYEGMLSALQRLAALPISAAQFARIDSLRRELGPQAPVTGPMGSADREDELSDWLTDRGVPREWVLAPVLAGAGADVGWCERVAEAMDEPALEPALEWVAHTVAANGLLGEVKESTRRISDLVSAVKSYSQLDRASMQVTDLVEGLESTLVMLAHRTPAEVTVVRDYGADVPRIQARAAELNQVWTNLVTNALEAMAGPGTLRVSTRVGRGAVFVEVADTGPGMSAETRQHAFDPFYTTKGVGEGTGLGLDISRRIVEQHNGDISVDSRPGLTVFRVRLPIASGDAVLGRAGGAAG
ncbi:ATP-binding protein [Modestobacter versicolor]|uniref:ATP-binding protein n=1 Tax=Modestobacter versicolor TaxID=429133 RepID=UPI0034DF94BE